MTVDPEKWTIWDALTNANPEWWDKDDDEDDSDEEDQEDDD